MPTIISHELEEFIQKMYSSAVFHELGVDDTKLYDHIVLIPGPGGATVEIDLKKVFEIKEGETYIQGLPDIGKAFLDHIMFEDQFELSPAS